MDDREDGSRFQPRASPPARLLSKTKSWLRSMLSRVSLYWQLRLLTPAQLKSQNISLPLHSTHITLLLSSMNLFPEANAAYVKYFGTSPPSRACVAVPLPEGERIRIEVVGFDDQAENAPVGGRTALHVQGLSYWAPANIGPYSQAVTVSYPHASDDADVQVNSRLHIAGQISLQPPSLTFAPYPPAPSSPYPHQAALALQHVGRIIDVLRNPNSTGGGWTGWVESCVCWWSRPKGLGSEGPEVAQRVWKAWAEEVSCLLEGEELTSRTTALVHPSSSYRRRSSPAARWSSTRSTLTLAG